MHQFLQLWARVDTVQLSDSTDIIQWMPNGSGIYSARSANECQFWGQIQQPHLERVWKAKVEGKVKFFVWLLLQNRNWTADRLAKRNLNCNPICCLCDQELECAAHLAVGCCYANEVWQFFVSTNEALVRVSSQANSLRAWWNKIPKNQRSKNSQLACYVVWHIWKERGRRVFEGKELNALVLAQRIIEEVVTVVDAGLV